MHKKNVQSILYQSTNGGEEITRQVQIITYLFIIVRE